MANLINDTMVGQICSFQSKAVNDTQTWQGRIDVSRCNADIARMFRDIVTYNNEVRLFDPDVSTDLSTLNFFVLTVQDSTGVTAKTSFAQEWITDNSFKLITQDKKIQVTVFDAPGNNHENIVNILRQSGYVASITDIV